MSEKMELPQDPVDRQVTALQDLERLIAERSEAEQQLEQNRSRRMEAIERAFRQEMQAIEVQAKSELAELERRAKEEPSAAQSTFEAVLAQAEATLGLATAEAERKYRDEIEAIKSTQADQRWEVGTICEAGLNDAKARLEAAQQSLDLINERLQGIRDEVKEYLRSHRLGTVSHGIEGNGDSEASQEPSEEPSAEIAREAVDQVEARLDDLERLKLPELFRGPRPVGLVLLPAGGAAVAAGFSLGWVPWGLVGGGVGGVLGLVSMFWLYATARGQAERALGPIREAINRASRLARQARQHEADRYQRRERELLSKRDREQSAADHRAKLAASEAKCRFEATRDAAKNAHESAVSSATATRDDVIRRIEEEVARRSPEIKQRFENDRAALQKKYDEDVAAARERSLSEAAELARRWRSRLVEIWDSLGQVESEMLKAFPPFADVPKEDSPVPVAIPPALRFGRLRVELDMFPNGRPTTPGLMEDLPDRFEPPAIVRCPEGCSLLFKSDAESRAEALKAVQATMLRILSGFPPGKARFTMIDPVGLGQTFAAFMHLADVDEQLVTNRVWTETQHIEQRLQDLTEHMENVIQKYLRNEYRSITEYNARAGEVAEPYRFLVVADFPVRFNEATARRLLSIAQSGPRCGVHVIVSVDVRQELPQGIDLKDLERHCSVIQWRDGHLRWADPVQGRFPLKIDTPPEPELFSEMVRAVGHRAEGASRVEVPFEFLAPPPDRYWTADSAEGLAIPIGRAGATKIQQLKLGSGTAQHVLIAGKTGSGKSTLLHAMITSAALTYAPDQLELYLIDFKKGVEFKAYATHQLPHARVIAVESEREFGLSVLQKLDDVLRERGDLFREAGAQDVASFRRARPDMAMPRILLVVDEFQEFFVEDDKIAQEAALLLDRLVRQGRAFGIHVHLGSQTLAGAYTLARATIGQMAVRIALQCSEADASLILSDDNTAARLLSRPGEAIYNDANGRLEGNSIFQVVWLPDERREEFLNRIETLAVDRLPRLRPPIVFEGNVTPEASTNGPLGALIEADSYPEPLPRASSAWLGEPVAIKEPTAMRFRRQAGAHLLIVGQNEGAARGLTITSLISLAAHRPDARFVILDGTPADDPQAEVLAELSGWLPHNAEVVSWGQVEDRVARVAEEVDRRRDAGITDAPPLYLIILDLQRFRQLRKAEDDFSFSTPSPDEPPKPSELLATILRDGPVHGIHAILWADTLNNLNRTFDRSTLRELEYRVLFQMSSGDSSTLIDSPLANRLGMNRALFVSEEAGLQERFRPYGPPPTDWLRDVSGRLSNRARPN